MCTIHTIGVTRVLLVISLCCGLGAVVAAHNIGVTPVTWNREISRLVFDKCASCHRPGGTSFSMMTYQEVQPRLVEIKTAVLTRRMPPWGAIKGFGEFRNDQALTQEQIELIVDWIQNDAPRGNNRRALPDQPKVTEIPPYQLPAGTMRVTGTTRLSRAVLLDGLMPDRIAPTQSARLIASRPDGSVEPLVWLHEYDDRHPHPFLFRKAITLPAGTVISGVPNDAVIGLIPH
jgi:hypothetical protein